MNYKITWRTAAVVVHGKVTEGCVRTARAAIIVRMLAISVDCPPLPLPSFAGAVSFFFAILQAIR